MEIGVIVSNLLSSRATPSVLEKAVFFVLAFWLVRKEIRSIFKEVRAKQNDLHTRQLATEKILGVVQTKASEELWKDA